MKKTKLLTPLMSAVALTTGAATISTLASCNKSTEWYDLTKDFTPSKQLSSSKPYTGPELMSAYVKAIENDNKILKDDIIWSLKKCLNWKLNSIVYSETYKNVKFSTFKVKYDNFKITNELNDSNLPCIRLSCKFVYDLDMSYESAPANGKETAKLTGSFEFKDMPLCMSLTDEDEWNLINYKDEAIYTPIYSYTLGELKNDSKWSFTMNESGTMTQSETGKFEIKDFTWNKDTIAKLDTPAISVFSTFLFDFQKQDIDASKGEAYTETYGIIFSYYLDKIDGLVSKKLEPVEPAPAVDPAEEVPADEANA